MYLYSYAPFQVNLKCLEVGKRPQYIFGRMNVIETIVAIVYKQGHLFLGFLAYLSQVYSVFDRSWVPCYRSFVATCFGGFA